MNQRKLLLGTLALTGALVFTLGTSPVAAQARGEGGGRGQAAAGRGGQPAIDYNAGMPWEAIRNATRGAFPGGPTAQKTEPFKIFDNLYYVGLETVAAFVVPTSDGLILLDATYSDTSDFVLDGVRKLGLDPKRIKYLPITHFHNDHTDGAGHIKQVTGARIGMAVADWESYEKLRDGANGRPPAPGVPFTRDWIIKDGDVTTLGDTTLKWYVLPGHTEGSIAFEMQARGNGRTFRTLVGVSFTPGPGLVAPSIKTVERLKQIGPWDALIPCHPFLASVALPITAKQILIGDPLPKNPTGHPAAVGSAAINKYFDVILKSLQATQVKEQALAAANGR